MSTTIGNAYVQILPSAKGIGTSVSQQLNNEAGGAGASAGSKIGTGIKTALVAAGIGIALKETIMEGAKLEQSIGGVETLFKGSAGRIKKYAINAWQTAGVSANSYMELATSFSASLLQSLGGDTRKAAKVTDMAVRDMADNANKMGTPMEMIQQAYQSFARGNYVMLDNLKLGYGGTKSEMERLLSDAQELTGVEYDINNLSDVYEAIHVIQEELGITGTTAEEAEHTILGSFNAMKAAAQNLLGQLVTGAPLEDIETTMSNLIKASCTFLFKNLVPAIGNIIRLLPSAIGTFIEEGLPMLAVEGGKLIQGIVDGIETGLPTLLNNIPIYYQQALDKLSDNLPLILQKGGELMLQLGQAIIDNLPLLYQKLGELRQMAMDWIDENGELIAQKLGELLGKLAIYIITHLPQIIKAAGLFVLGVIKQLSKMPGMARKIGKALLIAFLKEIVPESVQRKFNKVKNAITHPIETAKKKIKAAIDKIKSYFNITLKFRGIKLPHITVGWKTGGTLGKIASKMGLPGVPDFGVSWYKKGGIFSDPSVIGVGEAGTEAVLPLDPFWERMDRIVDAAEGGGRVINLTVNINQPCKTPLETARAVKREMRMGLAGAL